MTTVYPQHPQPSIAELDAARSSAIDLSGWGRRVAFYQPRNLAFWGYLVLVGGGFLVFADPCATGTTPYKTSTPRHSVRPGRWTGRQA